MMERKVKTTVHDPTDRRMPLPPRAQGDIPDAFAVPHVALGPSDADLLPRLAAGDQQAFAVLYDRYRQKLLDYARQQNQSLDEHAARDLVSEVFRNILQDRHRLLSVRNLRSYLTGITGNLAARNCRNTKTSPLPPDIASSALSPDAAMERDELNDKLKKAMAFLPYSHRQALELVRDGHSIKDIASATNCTPKAVRRRIEKALTQVRNTLSPRCNPCALEQQHPGKCPARKENLFCDKLRHWHMLQFGQ